MGLLSKRGAIFSWIAALGRVRSSLYFLPASDLPSQKAASPPSDIKLVANRPEGGAVLLVEDEATVRTFCGPSPAFYAGIPFWLLNRVKGR